MVPHSPIHPRSLGPCQAALSRSSRKSSFSAKASTSAEVAGAASETNQSQRKHQQKPGKNAQNQPNLEISKLQKETSAAQIAFELAASAETGLQTETGRHGVIEPTIPGIFSIQ